ncbi:MAG: phospholipid carrier-dependent glycosyltransferase [Dehalococcoidales bacterium]
MMPETAPEPLQEPLKETIPETGPDVIPEVKPRSRWQRLLHWEFLGLFLIVLTALIFHIVSIDRPPSIVWDEVWYVGDARSIFSGTGELRPEHPPLAKLFIVAGDYIFNGFKTPELDSGVQNSAYISGDSTNGILIPVTNAARFTVGQTILINAEQMNVTGVNLALNNITVERGAGGSTVIAHMPGQEINIFTDTAFGWRFFSIIFGILGIIIFYFICRKLKFPWKATMLATFLFAFEDMTFLHSGLALLDVYMVTFLLAAVLAYLDEKYIWMGILVALSALCKMDGVLIFIAIFIHWAVFRKDKRKEFTFGLVTAAVAFVVLLVFFDFFIKGGIENPITRINSMLSSTAANRFTVPKLSISSRPWVWLYPQFINPDYNSPVIIYSFNPQYISFISSTIQILIIPTIGYMIYKAIKKSEAAAFVLLWFIATYLVWIPINLATNRVTFVFYFLSTTPAICIGLGMAISDWLDYLKKRRAKLERLSTGVALSYGAIALYLLIHLAIFVILNPAIPPIITTWPPF